MAGRTRQVKVLKKWREMHDKGFYFECGICSSKIEFSYQLSVDHITPKSLGGKNHPYNFQPAHKGCNNRRGNKLIEEARNAKINTN